MKRLGLCLLLLAFPAMSALAGNAPWYRWESKMDGRRVCAQTSPGEGWLRLPGAWRDAACRYPR